MRRVRRDNTPGDVALMAVITKAMGAFLILMIMLVPYYTSDPAQAPGVDEMRQRLNKVTEDVRTLIDQAGTVSTEDILKRLKEALEELERARELVADLKARLDQASAVVRRLETELANANQSLAQARSRVAELEQTVARQESELQRQATQIASLQAENERLRRELEKMRGGDTAPLLDRIARLEQQVKDLAAENQQLKRQLADLQAQYALVEQENARLRQRSPSVAHIVVMAAARCPADAIEVVLVRPQAGGSSEAVAHLAPWTQEARWSEIAPLGVANVGFPAAHVVREGFYITVPRERPAALDVFLRFKSREAFDKELQTQTQRLAGVLPRQPTDGAQTERMIDEAVKRIIWNCTVSVSAIADKHMYTALARFSALEPVVLMGHFSVEADRDIKWVSPRNALPKVQATMVQSFCKAIPEHCNLVRRAAAQPL